ncbi:hypothetical protein PR048_012971 [Dryococelus australis]|uniref:DDE Tnp4 domain-containing protein n=1 Tax=Dryococelus australis TaxID=614101 RepID=A0ABQ9HQW6_9NEOP|nr:hypothetical protein PR048_012971 [Dryococelus australis]
MEFPSLSWLHIVIQASEDSGSYFNYTGTYSIVLLAVVDSLYRFTYLDVGCNGRVCDGVFGRSTISNALKFDPFTTTKMFAIKTNGNF